MGCDPALEAEFVESWERMIKFYEDDLLCLSDWIWLAPLVDLIVALAEAGYDRKLRAGQSMYAFIVSRSRAHGMRPDQASIVMMPNQRTTTLAISGWGLPISIPLDGEIDPRLRERLDQLVEMPID